MKASRRRVAVVVAVSAAAVVSCLVAYVASAARARAKAPPLVTVTGDTYGSLREAFDAGAGGTRVVALLSPT